MTSVPVPRSQDLAAAAEAVAAGTNLEALTRPFLDLLHSLTGLESVYLTQVDWDRDEQRILYSQNRGSITIPEGLRVTWSDTVCRRSIDAGVRATDDVPTTFPGSQAAKELGLRSYVSVPVVDHREQVIGTLCGASGERVAVPPEVLNVMDMFARLIADQWERDRQRVALHERAEEAERRLRERAVYLAEAEHKLKSPVTVIMGWSQMLLEEWESMADHARRQGVEKIARSAEVLSTQVVAMLDEARSQVMSGALELHRIDVSPVVEQVVDELNAVSSLHRVSVQSPGCAVARVDDAALWQVLVHLGENAIKYSPDGGAIEFFITVHAGEEDAPGHICIAVQDEGLGVPDDIDLFAPFTRSGLPEFQAIGGTGVGLHVVRTLVESMQGTVSARRNELHGSTFTVAFPSP